MSPSAPLCTSPTATSRTLWQLHRTRSLAIWISKSAAPSDAEWEARGVSLLTADSRRTSSQGTNDPPTSPAETTSQALPGSRPTPDTCALSSSWQPSMPPVRVSRARACRVSIASCAPPNNGNPSAMISNRRVVTRAPPRQILAAALHRETSSSQDPCPSASCSVVTTRTERTATPAVAGGQRQRETKTTQQEHAGDMSEVQPLLPNLLET